MRDVARSLEDPARFLALPSDRNSRFLDHAPSYHAKNHQCQKKPIANCFGDGSVWECREHRRLHKTIGDPTVRPKGWMSLRNVKTCLSLSDQGDGVIRRFAPRSFA